MIARHRLGGTLVLGCLVLVGCSGKTEKSAEDLGALPVGGNAEEKKEELPELASVDDLMDKKLPRFELPNLAGGSVSNATIKGKLTIFAFWATVDGPCVLLAPVLQSLHREFAKQPVVIIGANVEERDGMGNLLKTKDRAEAFAKKHNCTYTFVYGADEFKEICKAKDLPTILVVDPTGTVRSVFVGYNDKMKDNLQMTIKALLMETHD